MDPNRLRRKARKELADEILEEAKALSPLLVDGKAFEARVQQIIAQAVTRMTREEEPLRDRSARYA